MTTRATTNGSVTDAKICELEEKLDALIWYHAELALRFQAVAGALSALLAQQMQPQVQQAILSQLLGR